MKKSDAMIDVAGLRFTYAGSADPALAGLGFAVERGEIFGFLGPSGAGKSTTQKVLIRLLQSYAGAVTVMGRPLNEWGSEYYERIGVSFEAPNHFLKLTALENLRYFAALHGRTGRSPAELLEMFGLAQDAATPVGRFSKGMMNRLTVARALLHGPDLLFLDEPTSGLDPGNARRVREIIRGERAAGRTVFLTTHDMTTADEICDRVAFMVDGRIECIDSPRELRLRFGEPGVRIEYDDGAGVHTRDFALAELGHAGKFLDLLRSGAVRTIHTREASLEDVFIRVTGAALT
jgi:fluoroquinolone transport system ATP-binding protein